jgi:Zn-dependent metalloprotease
MESRIGETPNAKAAHTVLAFLEKEGRERLGISDLKKEVRIFNIETDPNFPQQRIVRIQQLINNIPVFGARATLVVKPGERVVSVTSGFAREKGVTNLDPAHRIIWHQAVSRAIANSKEIVGDQKQSHSFGHGPYTIETRLLIFEPTRVGLKRGEARLAWMVRLDTLVMFIDASSGSLLFQYNNFKSAMDRWTYDLDGEEELATNKVLDENGPTGGSTISVDAWSAHNNAAKSYEFFAELGRHSYDDKDGIIISNVRHDSSEYAQWHPDGFLIFGPLYPQALDVAGHEFTHGVIDYSAGLIYWQESGALSESIADFFGAEIEGIDHMHNWTIGEDLPAGVLRDMKNPHKGVFDPDSLCHVTLQQGFYPKCPPWSFNRGQPEHYSEFVTEDLNICRFSADRDNGCVHYNSGIFNKAAYLLSDGGNHHHIPVQGIGRKKVARILYRALVTKMNPSSQMSEAAISIVDSCTELIGQYDISGQDCSDVKMAFVAVGLSSP